MRPLNQKGINLIELVAAIVVAGIAIPVLMNMWATVSWRSVGSENVAEATSFARALMEEIRSRRFDQNTNSPWTASANLGIDAGENRADSRTFNDVDDYTNATDPNIINPGGVFNRSVSVDYVYPDAANIWQACPAAPCGNAANCLNCGECCYKRIRVNVSRSGGKMSNVTLTTVVEGN